KLLGFRSDIDELTNISDLFVFPSFREGLSLALMEAMSSGLPIVCSKIRGNMDLVENESGGFLINPSDIQGFASAIEKVKQDNLLRESMAKINKTKIKM